MRAMLFEKSLHIHMDLCVIFFTGCSIGIDNSLNGAMKLQWSYNANDVCFILYTYSVEINLNFLIIYR